MNINKIERISWVCWNPKQVWSMKTILNPWIGGCQSKVLENVGRSPEKAWLHLGCCAEIFHITFKCFWNFSTVMCDFFWVQVMCSVYQKPFKTTPKQEKNNQWYCRCIRMSKTRTMTKKDLYNQDLLLCSCCCLTAHTCFIHALKQTMTAAGVILFACPLQQVAHWCPTADMRPSLVSPS